jgi:small subunit ribosomal protein S9
MQEQFATGRRKTAVASVRIRDGKGSIDINKKAFDAYFPMEIQRKCILAPFEKASMKKDHLDIIVRVRGGGIEAQATAMRLGIARALVKNNEDLKHVLKEDGFLTRDSRKKERKKYGQVGARKRFQFSKR